MGGVGPWAIGPTLIDLDLSVEASILCCGFVLSHLLKFVLGNSNEVCFVSERRRVGKIKCMKEKVETLRLHRIIHCYVSLSLSTTTLHKLPLNFLTIFSYVKPNK